MLASDMTFHSVRQLLGYSAPFAIAVAAFGCNTAPQPASPSPAPPPAAAAPAKAAPAKAAMPSKPAHPDIVGTVLMSTTQKPAPMGGVVYLDDSPKKPGALMQADIIIHKKKFLPFISVITAGGTASFANTDTVDHHVFSSTIKGWDTGVLKKGSPVAKTFDSPGPIALLCNIHPEMLGYLLVIPSTSFGRIDADGTYAIGDVPPGTYKATVWVPRQPTVTQSVTVGAGGPAALDFVVKPSGEAAH